MAAESCARACGTAGAVRAGRGAVGAVFEARRADDAAAPRIPGGGVARRRRDGEAWGNLDALERDQKLYFLREPDPGFVWAAYRWAEGDELEDVLGAPTGSR